MAPSMVAHRMVVLALIMTAPSRVGWGRRPPPDDGLTCGGTLIQIGDPLGRVRDACGPPSQALDRCDAEGRHCSGTWVYRRDGSFPRSVDFSDDVVQSIRATSRFP
jgi:hypothetical protein